MAQLTLIWSGPFKMTQETPKRLRGRPGLFAIVHNSDIINIGKAQNNNAVFREAKNRENKWIKCLKEEGVIPETLSNTASYKYVWSHCRIYVGTKSEDQRLNLLGDAEKLLIYKMQPPCNMQHKKRYIGVKPFLVVNNGDRPPGLPAIIQYPDP